MKSSLKSVRTAVKSTAIAIPEQRLLRTQLNSTEVKWTECFGLSVKIIIFPKKRPRYTVAIIRVCLLCKFTPTPFTELTILFPIVCRWQQKPNQVDYFFCTDAIQQNERQSLSLRGQGERSWAWEICPK